MIELCHMPAEERELYFRSAAEKMNVRYEIIEKDYWVVWVLNKLFSLKSIKSYLTFKGGTSLSKIYRTIERFSEDIDLSIEKEFLGFPDPESAPSKKKQREILEKLAKACSDYVQSDMLKDLKESFHDSLKESWNLFPDPEDPDEQTLLFEYPSNVSNVGYIRPLVKIEVGARSEHWPVSDHHVHSYAKEMLEDKVYEPKTTVRVLNAERTFWEKATILHQYSHLPDQKKVPPRISRHFYDFHRLLQTDVKRQALMNIDLLERVALHKSIYFSSAWASYGTARKGSLKLVPPQRVLVDLEHDYALMEPMFFHSVPQWEHILTSISDFEQEFNSLN